VRRDHDLVLLDQRGTGGENRLDCPVSDRAFVVVIVPKEGHVLARLDGCVAAMTREFLDTARANPSCAMHGKRPSYALRRFWRVRSALCRTRRRHGAGGIVARRGPIPECV